MRKLPILISLMVMLAIPIAGSGLAQPGQMVEIVKLGELGQNRGVEVFKMTDYESVAAEKADNPNICYITADWNDSLVMQCEFACSSHR